MTRNEGTPRVERSGARVWTWPAVAALGSLAAALALAPVRPDPESTLSGLAWPGDVDAASTMLQILATAAITTLTLTFTLTVVALQLASQQFSPRLLRDFMRDTATKSVIAVLVATFVFTVTVLRGVRADAEVPAIAMLVAFVLGLGSVGALLAFIDHIMVRLRVDTMMRVVHAETSRAIETFYPAYDDTRPRSPAEVDTDESARTVIDADSSGFVRSVDVDALVRAARHHDVLVRVVTRPGDHVVRGTPMATVSSSSGPPPAELERAVRAAVLLGYERTIEQDAAFGFRQLTDIAVKALSPGINDPVTAAHSVGHLGELLAQLVNRRLGPTLHEDEDGVGRAVVPDRDLRYYLDLVCGPIRRYGEREPTVLAALLRMLRDAAVQTRDDAQRTEIDGQVRLILDQLPRSLAKADAEQVEDLAARVRAALHGDLLEAYLDRSGETRSL